VFRDLYRSHPHLGMIGSREEPRRRGEVAPVPCSTVATCPHW